MPSPFPGMDPYLEDPAGWPDFHAEFLTGIRAKLAPRVAPDFYVRIEDRVYVTDPETDPGYSTFVPDLILTSSPTPRPSRTAGEQPAGITSPLVLEEVFDLEIHDRYLEVRDRRTHEVVTAIELLSPANKVAGSRGREQMHLKSRAMRDAGVNWIEIDLLRAGERYAAIRGRDAYAVISRPSDTSRLLVWSFGIRDPLPTVAVPLRAPHLEVPLELGGVFGEAYERARYADSVDYAAPVPPPPLAASELEWVSAQVAQWRDARA